MAFFYLCTIFFCTVLPLTLCFILVSIIFFLRYPVKFFIFGRVVFFIDTVSMVVYTTICAKLRLRNRRLVGGYC